MSITARSVANNACRFSKSWLFLALIILFVIFVRVRLLEIPLERDEGEYAYMGQLILQGIPPYGEAYNMKFPGTYLMYAVIMAIFGQTAEGIHIGLTIVNCAAILLVYLLARKIVDDTPAAVAAGTYAVLSLSSSVFGFAAHATHFVVLPALAGTVLLLRALEKDEVRLFFLSGALLGISVIMKQPGIFFVLSGAAYILWKRAYFKLSGSTAKRKACLPLFQLGAFSLGALLPVLITALWLYAAGVFDRFWFWTVVYASRYAAQVSLPDALLRLKNSFSQVADGFFLFWILAALGFVAMLFNTTGDSSPGGIEPAPEQRQVVSAGGKANKGFVFLFAFFSFLSICPGFYFRSHYYLTLLPAVSLLFGIFIHFLSSGSLAFFKVRLPRLIGVGIFFAAATIGIIQQRDDLFADDPLRLSGLIYSGNPFPESLEIARFVEQRTAPNDRIAVFGSEPQIFFYAKRRSATGYIYTYSLMEIHEYALAMQKEMIAEVEASKPKFVIDVTAGVSWSQQDESEKYIFSWLDSYVATNYDLVGIADMIYPGLTIYRWYGDARDYKIQSPSSLLIYERK